MATTSKGRNLMAFVDDKAIALATSHTLTISPSILEDRTKDDGDAPVAVFDNYSWTVSSENIVGSNDNVTNEATVVELIDTMLSLAKVGVAMDAGKPLTGAVPESGWAPQNVLTQYMPSVGTAYIESLSVSAGATGFATSSISFKGQGALSASKS
jgi:hypothetical protein